MNEILGGKTPERVPFAQFPKSIDRRACASKVFFVRGAGRLARQHFFDVDFDRDAARRPPYRLRKKRALSSRAKPRALFLFPRFLRARDAARDLLFAERPTDSAAPVEFRFSIFEFRVYD